MFASTSKSGRLGDALIASDASSSSLLVDSDDSDDEQFVRDGNVTKALLVRRQLKKRVQATQLQLSAKDIAIENMRLEYGHKIDLLETRFSDMLHQKQLLVGQLQAEAAARSAEAGHQMKQLKDEAERAARENQRLRLFLDNADDRLAAGAERAARRREMQLGETPEPRPCAVAPEDLEQLRQTVVEMQRSLDAIKQDNQRLSARNQQLETLVNTDAAATSPGHTINVVKDAVAKDARASPENEKHPAVNGIDASPDNTQSAIAKAGKLDDSDQEVRNMLSPISTSQRQAHHSRHQAYGRHSPAGDVEMQLLQADHARSLKDVDDLRASLSDARHAAKLLKQDKEFLARQKVELTNRVLLLEERLAQGQVQLDEARRARELLYERYVDSRDATKSDYDRRLHEELAALKANTTIEVERVKTNLKELYEAELLSLRQARQDLLTEHHALENRFNEQSHLVDQLKDNLIQLRTSYEGRLAEALADLKVKTYDLQRFQLIHDEDLKLAKLNKIEKDKLQCKLDLLVEEFRSSENEHKLEVARLETQLEQLQARASAQERVAFELGDAVLHAVNPKLNSASEPTKPASSSASEVVELSRRILTLEREKGSLAATAAAQATELEELRSELRLKQQVLREARQPTQLLAESVEYKVRAMEALERQVERLRARLKEATARCKQESAARQRLEQDLQLLLGQTQQLDDVKQLLSDLRAATPSQPPVDA